jgi:hypothetical protein
MQWLCVSAGNEGHVVGQRQKSQGAYGTVLDMFSYQSHNGM